MSKAQTLANLVSTGSVLEDGTIAASEVSGLPATVVGVDDTQTLTNKTISFADNTLTGAASTGKAIAMAIVFGG